jgi:hypothetical protein
MNHTKTKPVDGNDVGVEMLLAARSDARAWWTCFGLSWRAPLHQPWAYSAVHPKRAACSEATAETGQAVKLHPGVVSGQLSVAE